MNNSREKNAGRASAIAKALGRGALAVEKPVESALLHAGGGMAVGSLAGLGADKLTGHDTNPWYWAAGGAAAGLGGKGLSVVGKSLEGSGSRTLSGLGTAAKWTGTPVAAATGVIPMLAAQAVDKPLHDNRVAADARAEASQSGILGMSQARSELEAERKLHSQDVATHAQANKGLQEQVDKVQPKDWAGTASSLWDRTPNWGKGLAIGAGALGAGHLVNKMTRSDDEEEEEGAYRPNVGMLGAGVGTGLALSSMADHNWRNLVSPEWWQKSSKAQPLILYKQAILPPLGGSSPGVPQNPFAAAAAKGGPPPTIPTPPTPGTPPRPSPSGTRPSPIPGLAQGQTANTAAKLVAGIGMGGGSAPGLGTTAGLTADTSTEPPAIQNAERWRTGRNPALQPQDLQALDPSELNNFANDRAQLTAGPMKGPAEAGQSPGGAKSAPAPVQGPPGVAKPSGGPNPAVGAVAGPAAQAQSATGGDKPALHPVAEKALAKQFGGDMNAAQEAAWNHLQQQVPPAVQQKGPEGVWEWMKHIWSSLSESQQVMLGVGLALGAVGLITSMSGGGGMAGPLLGIGGAALAGGMGYMGYQQGQKRLAGGMDASGGLAPPGPKEAPGASGPSSGLNPAVGAAAGPMIGGHPSLNRPPGSPSPAVGAAAGPMAAGQLSKGGPLHNPGGTQGGGTDTAQEIAALAQDPNTKEFFTNGRPNREAIGTAALTNPAKLEALAKQLSPALRQQIAQEAQLKPGEDGGVFSAIDPTVRAKKTILEILKKTEAAQGGAGTVNPNAGVGTTLPPDSEIDAWADKLIRNPGGAEAANMVQNFASMPDEAASRVLDRLRDRKWNVGTPEAVAAGNLYDELVQARGYGALRNLRTGDPKGLLGHKDQRVYNAAAEQAKRLAGNPEQAARLGYMNEQDMKQLGSIAQVTQDRTRLSRELRDVTVQLRDAEKQQQAAGSGPIAAELSKRVAELTKLREVKMQAMQQYGSR